jgi:PAS domain S-box-containing protein
MAATLDYDVPDPQRTIAELQGRLDEALAERDEALAQQTAAAEVLQVINSSAGNLQPVFKAMLEKALLLCECVQGVLWTFDGDEKVLSTSQGIPTEFTAILEAHPPRFLDAILAGERLIHVADLAAHEFYLAGDPGPKAAVEIGGVRTVAFVALVKDAAPLGAFAVSRREVRPFTDKQIALLDNFAAQAVIAMENARLLTETREALEQQTATAEVLQVINSSPGDLGPVFDAILDKAHTLCGAVRGTLFLFDGGTFRAAAVHGYPDELAERLRHGVSVPDAAVFAPLLAGARLIHNPDLLSIDDPIARAVAERGGVRTNLLLPLRKEGALLGVISCNRIEVRPFSDKQIALLQNFATQAVIAMENARLITETREALEQQTATAEVLQVINSLPGDLAPVFEAMLEKALHLCDAQAGYFLRYDGEKYGLAAEKGLPAKLSRYMAHMDQPRPGDANDRVLQGEAYIHTIDLKDTDSYRSGSPLRCATVDLGGIRTGLAVPLRKDGKLLGTFNVGRLEIHPFSERQIAIAQNFAAQAVIAMENARLINETREALEQQTATAEVLQVINASPGNLDPVFDTLLQKAMQLCGAAFGMMTIAERDHLSTVATRGVPDVYREFRQLHPPPATAPIARRILSGEPYLHTLDVKREEAYRLGDPQRRALVDLAGARTSLVVALKKDRTVLGAVHIYRTEVRAFSEKQIALLQNFAVQAVIAMENARLLTETREALEQQTATAEVLQVINSSPGDLAPVFDAMLEKTMRLCDARFGQLVTSADGEVFTIAAAQGPPAIVEFLRNRPPTQPGPGTSMERLVHGERCVHVHDAMAEEAYRRGDPTRRALVDLGGCRTLVSVGLRKDDALLGAITVYRSEVKPFSTKEIALIENFAAQAVIAMESARLLNEIRQRQAELRVTFDNMADGVAMFDEALRLAAWNRNFQQLLQLPDDLLTERPAFDTYIRYLTERGEFGETNPETQIERLRVRIGDHYSFERTRPDGTVIEVRHNPMPDGGIVLIFSDVTERKRSEAEIRAARDAAEAAYRDLKTAQSSLLHAQKMASLGQLTAGIAHEIKNPLNFVNNFAGLSIELLDELKETAAPAINSLDQDTRTEIDETINMLTSNLEKIAEHGQRADGIVKSMLEHSRGASGERRAIDLNGLIDEALNLAYHGSRAQDQSFNVTLERDYDATIAPIELVPQDITRVCLNLFGNGFYATRKRQKEGGDPAFKSTLKVSTRDLGDAVEIRIRDNGVGIPNEIKDKLFQPFFTTKPTGEGTGLGLSISYDIVTQEHGGAVTVDSRVGEFTEFTIRLPRMEMASAEAAS